MDTPDKKKVVTRGSRTPVAQKLCYKEVIPFGSGTLHRSFSFSQFWTPAGEKGTGTEVTQIKVSNFQFPGPSSQKRKRKEEKETSSRNDSSKKLKSSKAMAGGVSEATERRYRYKMILYWVVVVGAAAVMSVSYYPGKKIIWPLFNLEGELTTSLFGQAAAVEKLVAALDIAMETELPTAIALTGPLGVGKSYASSIIQRNYPWKHKITFVTADKLPETDLVALVLSVVSPGWHLLIVEDCSISTSESVVSLVKSLLARAKRTNTKLIVFIIYTYRTTDELQDFKNLLTTDMNYYHIPFAYLDSDAVAQCFLTELGKEGLEVSSADLETLVKREMEYVEEFRGPPGCKQISAKIVQVRTKTESFRSDDEL